MQPNFSLATSKQGVLKSLTSVSEQNQRLREQLSMQRQIMESQHKFIKALQRDQTCLKTQLRKC